MEESAEPEKLDLRSHDVAADGRRELLRLFPEVATEGGKLDFERLKLALGEAVDVGKERFGLTWPGKADCFRTIQAPSLATLRPCRDESVDFDTTQNLILEGDNLEVLKLLQKSYLGRVKMIYIDPPYNTGKDFIYPDNYTESLQTYLEYTGQVDAEGRKFGTNTDTDGRFHSKWLNMMYPRLYLARNLLREDGVIFVSCDDNEVHNLRGLMNEVFGEENFCGVLVWEKKRKPSFLNAQMGITTEYVVSFAQRREAASPFTSGQVEAGKLYPFNNAGNPVSTLSFAPGSVEFWVDEAEFQPQDMSEGNIKTELLDVLEVKGGRNAKTFRLRGEWRYSQAKLDEFTLAGDRIVIRRAPFRPNYINPGNRDKKIANLLTVKGSGTPTYEDATDELRMLFGGDVIEYPKPSGLLRTLIDSATSADDLILDFFAGSGTTAHAVLDLNKQDGGSRKFILVQLPEPTGREDYPTIADITKERVRRVIDRIHREDAKVAKKEEGDLFPSRSSRLGGESLGFRVFKLAESNFTTWDSEQAKDAEGLARQLFDHVDHIRDGRTEGDLLHEILLKSGFPLTTPVEKLDLAGKAVHSVAGGALLVCLGRALTLELIRAMAERTPERVVCLDEGFAKNDQLKANAVQIFKTKGVTSFRTV